MPGIKNFISSDFKNCLVENEKFSMYIYEGLLFLLLCTAHCILDTDYVSWGRGIFHSLYSVVRTSKY